MQCRLFLYDVDAAAYREVSSQHEDRVPEFQPERVPNLLEQPLVEVDMAGIFDIKWRPALPSHATDPVLAIALADGRVSLMHLVSDQSGHTAQQPDDVPSRTTAAGRKPGSRDVHGDSMPSFKLHELSAATIEPDGAMVLSVDWSSRRPEAAHDVALVTSTSSGAVATLQVGHGWGIGVRPRCHNLRTVVMWGFSMSCELRAGSRSDHGARPEMEGS